MVIIMKKKFWIIILVLFIGACGTDAISSGGLLNPEDLSIVEKCQDKKAKQVVQRLSFPEEKVKEVEEGGFDVRITLPYTRNILEEEYEVFYYFLDGKFDRIAYQLNIKLTEELQEYYGEPETYEGIENRITVEREEFLPNSSHTYWDYWGLSETLICEVVLNMPTEKSGRFIRITYRKRPGTAPEAS